MSSTKKTTNSTGRKTSKSSSLASSAPSSICSILHLSSVCFILVARAILTAVSSWDKPSPVALLLHFICTFPSSSTPYKPLQNNSTDCKHQWHLQKRFSQSLICNPTWLTVKTPSYLTKSRVKLSSKTCGSATSPINGC